MFIGNNKMKYQNSRRASNNSSFYEPSINPFNNEDIPIESDFEKINLNREN